MAVCGGDRTSYDKSGPASAQSCLINLRSSSLSQIVTSYFFGYFSFGNLSRRAKRDEVFFWGYTQVCRSVVETELGDGWA